MAKMYIMRGLPASGKTTFARAMVAKRPTKIVRVNRDDLRLMTHNGAHIKPVPGDLGTERVILAGRDALIDAWLAQGVDVIVDDTNLTDWHMVNLQKLAYEAAATVEIVDFRHVPVDVCIERDSRREGRARVGADVIMNMHMRFGNGTAHA